MVAYYMCYACGLPVFKMPHEDWDTFVERLGVHAHAHVIEELLKGDSDEDL